MHFKVENIEVILSLVKIRYSIKKCSYSLLYHLMKEVIAASVIEIQYIASRENTLNICTKLFEKSAFMKLLVQMLTSLKT